MPAGKEVELQVLADENVESGVAQYLLDWVDQEGRVRANIKGESWSGRDTPECSKGYRGTQTSVFGDTNICNSSHC